MLQDIHAGNSNRRTVALRIDSSENFPDYRHPLILVLAVSITALCFGVDPMNRVPCHIDMLFRGAKLCLVEKVKAEGSFSRSAVYQNTTIRKGMEYGGLESYLKTCGDEADFEVPEQAAVELHYLGRAKNIFRRHAKDARLRESKCLINLARWTWRTTLAADWPR